MLYLLWKLIRIIILKPLFIWLSRYNRHYTDLKTIKHNDGKCLYVMNTDYDCETVAIMTEICNRTEIAELYDIYDRINSALLRCECLGFIQNPLYGNPLNVRCAFEELGYEVENTEPNQLSDSDKAIVLIHWYTGGIKHILFQHWISRVGQNIWWFGYGNNAQQIDDAQMERFMKCRLYRICYRIKEKN